MDLGPICTERATAVDCRDMNTRSGIRARSARPLTSSLLSEEQLRQQVRVRLAQERLPVAYGVYKTHRGAGQPCVVCRRAVEAVGAQFEVDCAGVALIAHEACYMLWREESVKTLGPRRLSR